MKEQWWQIPIVLGFIFFLIYVAVPFAEWLNRKIKVIEKRQKARKIRQNTKIS